MPDPDSPDNVAPAAPPAAEPTLPAPSAPPARWKVIVGWCVERVRKVAPVAWRFVCDVARYYWGIREALKEYVVGFAPNLMAESIRQREVRLAPYESHNMAEFGPDGWKLSVPGRCVVCGEPSEKSPSDETLAVDDAVRAFWTPLIVILLGGTVGWFLLGRWIATLSIPLGFVVGYLLRTRMPVRMRLVRCDTHATRTNIPQVLAWGNTLVVRFGNKLVRKVFRYGETMDTVIPQTEASPADQPESSPPETIPLADSPHPDDSMIRHDAAPTYGEENPFPDGKPPSQ